MKKTIIPSVLIAFLVSVGSAYGQASTFLSSYPANEWDEKFGFKDEYLVPVDELQRDDTDKVVYEPKPFKLDQRAIRSLLES